MSDRRAKFSRARGHRAITLRGVMFLGRLGPMATIGAKGLCTGLIAAGLALSQAAAAQPPSPAPNADSPHTNSIGCPPAPKADSLSSSYQGSSAEPASKTQTSKTAGPNRANFSGEPASDDARQVADWVVETADNGGLPFVIIDKVDAKVFVFDAHGQLVGASRALVGLAKGDDTLAGVGNLALSAIRPDQRTTPAGRFVASLGADLQDKNVLWVDYAAGIALHRVVTTNPKEHRLERLATPSPLDKRISYGCINVPAKFYDNVVSPAFTGTNGIVYILPEIKSIQQVFFTPKAPQITGGGGPTSAHAQ